MSKTTSTKLMHNRDNFKKVIKDSIENLGNTLQHAPPNRSGQFTIEMRVCIKEIGEKGEERCRYDYFEVSNKEVIKHKKARH